MVLPLLADWGVVVTLQPTLFPCRMYLENALGDRRMSEALPSKSIVDAERKADLVVLGRNPPALASTPDALTGPNVQMIVASGAVVFEARKVASTEGTFAFFGAIEYGPPPRFKQSTLPALRHSEWVERRVVLIKDEERPERLNRCFCGAKALPDGTICPSSAQLDAKEGNLPLAVGNGGCRRFS